VNLEVTAAMNAIIRAPDEGTRYSARGSSMMFKARAIDTGGAFSFMEREMPAHGRMPPPHRHAGPESFYVLDGALEFLIDGEVGQAQSGWFVLVPEGVGHTFGNTSDEEARLLIIHMPAADGYFEGLDALWSMPTPPTAEQERELQRRHGLEPA
jgi:quercetin dioxygenase-like cupin family protein